jgi:hypothetical protein
MKLCGMMNRHFPRSVASHRRGCAERQNVDHLEIMQDGNVTKGTLDETAGLGIPSSRGNAAQRPVTQTVPCKYVPTDRNRKYYFR